MEADERAKKGIFLAFQSIPEVKGVKLFEFLRTIYNSRRDKKESFVSFKKIILPYLEELHIDKEFLRRDLNVGFSGGERRKIEILQLKLLQPTYIFLDEVDSGLDVDAFRSVAELLQVVNSEDNTFIIITHYFSILDYLDADEVIVIDQGKIVEQ
jgi:Fe-S cluster assembly ATP-binding protein